MMLQFIILMPLFWRLAKWCGSSLTRGLGLMCTALIIAGLWLWFYDSNIFHGPHQQDWYLLDRLFLSFLLYGILGTLAWQNRQYFNYLVQKYWWLAFFVGIGSFIWINQELLAFGWPLLLANAPYYKPSMMIYDLAVIALIAEVALTCSRQPSTITNWVHRGADLAYKAYLSNFFWAQLLWQTFGKKFLANEFWWGILIIYGLTWILAFISAWIFEKILQRFF
ncbi:hypothetical protein EQ500_04760 [Lactobacillus sp. XV13L]|nr:hypothetical protein [Lactobacillus sp. XV13L]